MRRDAAAVAATVAAAVAALALVLSACSGKSGGNGSIDSAKSVASPADTAPLKISGQAGVPAGSLPADDITPPVSSSDPYHSGRHDESASLGPDQQFLREMLNHHEGLIYLAHEAMKLQSFGRTKAMLSAMDAVEDAEKQEVARLLSSDYRDRHHAAPTPRAMTSADSVLKVRKSDFASAVSTFVVRHHRDGIAAIDSFMPQLGNNKVRALARSMRLNATKEIAVYSGKTGR